MVVKENKIIVCPRLV